MCGSRKDLHYYRELLPVRCEECIHDCGTESGNNCHYRSQLLDGGEGGVCVIRKDLRSDLRLEGWEQGFIFGECLQN